MGDSGWRHKEGTRRAGQCNCRPFAAAAKEALDMAEMSLGPTFKGLGAAATEAAKLPTSRERNAATQMLRHLSISEALDRHFIQCGTASWLAKLQKLLDAACSVARPVRPIRAGKDSGAQAVLDMDSDGGVSLVEYGARTIPGDLVSLRDVLVMWPFNGIGAGL